MEPKRQRTIWAGVGGLFVLAVGSGYLPDLRLAQELAAAKEEGLVQPRKLVNVPPSQNAYGAYDKAIRQNAIGMAKLAANPTYEWIRPSPAVRKLYKEIAEASKRSAFAVPAIPIDGPPYADRVMPNLETIAMGIAASGRNEEELAAAARVASHLRQTDPAEIPGTGWITVAERIATTATNLGLAKGERTAVFRSLGPLPEPKESLRQHVVAVLQRLDDPSLGQRSARRAREKLRYLRFWREFLHTVPSDPKAFAAAVKEAEPKMAAADEAVGIYRDYSRPTTTPWKDWAAAQLRVFPLLRE